MNAIVAFDSNGLIGNAGKIPWHFPEDLKFFQSLTLGDIVIMGRTTFESIGKPLKGRHNVVLTRDANYEAPKGVKVLNSKREVKDFLLESNLKDYSNPDGPDCWVIGGMQIYDLFWDDIDIWSVTHIPGEYSGDTYFPRERLARDFTRTGFRRISDSWEAEVLTRSSYSQGFVV